jgi:hypothetical protein
LVTLNSLTLGDRCGTPERRNAGTPERRNAGTPGRRDAGTLGRWDAAYQGHRRTQGDHGLLRSVLSHPNETEQDAVL